jgi:hypothetical protein
VVLTLVHREPPQQAQEVAHLIRESERRSGALTATISMGLVRSNGWGFTLGTQRPAEKLLPLCYRPAAY